MVQKNLTMALPLITLLTFDSVWNKAKKIHGDWMNDIHISASKRKILITKENFSIHYSLRTRTVKGNSIDHVIRNMFVPACTYKTLEDPVSD